MKEFTALRIYSKRRELEVKSVRVGDFDVNIVVVGIKFSEHLKIRSLKIFNVKNLTTVKKDDNQSNF